jgi:hypothetical protein
MPVLVLDGIPGHGEEPGGYRQVVVLDKPIEGFRLLFDAVEVCPLLGIQGVSAGQVSSNSEASDVSSKEGER